MPGIASARLAMPGIGTPRGQEILLNMGLKLCQFTN
jgi:hypothetical protein